MFQATCIGGLWHWQWLCYNLVVCVCAGGWWFHMRASLFLHWGGSASRMVLCLKTLCSQRQTSLCSTRTTASAESPGKGPRWEHYFSFFEKFLAMRQIRILTYSPMKWTIDIKKLLILRLDMKTQLLLYHSKLISWFTVTRNRQGTVVMRPMTTCM